MSKVILRCVNAKGEPTDMRISTTLGPQTLILEWNEKNSFQTEVPTKTHWTDKMGREHKSHNNYAQFLVDAYSDEQHGFHFEVATVEAEPVVKERPKRGRPPKEKKDEDTSV